MKNKELKTLKDLDNGINTNGYDESHLVSRYELKAEAVKWVKYLDMYPADKAFMEFFNLTEEDLK